MIAGSNKNEKPINNTGLDKVRLKCDCINGSIVNGIPKPILFSIGLSSPPGHEIYKEPRVKLFKKINKSVLSHIKFYLEDDDHKPVDFKNETITFTCQLFKIQYSYLYTNQKMSIYTRGIHTIIFVLIVQLYIQLYEYIYKGVRSIF